MIFIDIITADKLREQLHTYDPTKIIAIVVSRYQNGWAFSYQVIYRG